jgi:hypothetical protein
LIKGATYTYSVYKKCLAQINIDATYPRVYFVELPMLDA